jgi:hypothetical protein
MTNKRVSLGGWTQEDVVRAGVEQNAHFMIVDSSGERILTARALVNSWSRLEPCAVIVLVDAEMIFELKSILILEEK